MRALCAAIISAGAMIGLGLTAIGVGTRYNGAGIIANNEFVHLKQLDTPLLLILITLLGVLVSGIAATFLGLAYHHERRYYERHGHTMGAKTGVTLND